MNATPLRALLSAVVLLLLTRGAAQALTDCATPIMLGEVKMKDASLEEAVATIKAAAAKIEGFESSHLNLVVLGAPPQPEKRISMDLKDVPLTLVLEELARTFGLRMRIEPHAVCWPPPPCQSQSVPAPAAFRPISWGRDRRQSEIEVHTEFIV